MRIAHRDIAKVGVGVVVADMLSVLWLNTAGFFPLTVLGVMWTQEAILPIVMFDLALIILLVHWGWNAKLPINSPSERGLLRIAGIIFLAVAVMHLARLAFGWDLVLGEFSAPLWLSWLGVLIAAYLSYSSFHFATRGKK